KDATNSGVIPAGTTVVSKTANTVVMSANATGGGVAQGDGIVFSLPPKPAGSLTDINQTAVHDAWDLVKQNPTNDALRKTFELKLARGLAWGEVQRIERDYQGAWDAWQNEHDANRKPRLQEVLDWWTDTFDAARENAKAWDNATEAPL